MFLILLDMHEMKLVIDCEDCQRIFPEKKENGDCEKCPKRPCG